MRILAAFIVTMVLSTYGYCQSLPLPGPRQTSKMAGLHAEGNGGAQQAPFFEFAALAEARGLLRYSLGYGIGIGYREGLIRPAVNFYVIDSNVVPVLNLRVPIFGNFIVGGVLLRSARVESKVGVGVYVSPNVIGEVALITNQGEINRIWLKVAYDI